MRCKTHYITRERYDMKRKPLIFLSGPVAGRDWKEVTNEFKRYENLFKTLGFAVMNPCEFDCTDTEDRELTLRECFSHLSYADFIFMMPGWEEAKGCNAEWGYAIACNVKVLKSDTPDMLSNLINHLYDKDPEVIEKEIDETMRSIKKAWYTETHIEKNLDDALR